VPAKRFTVGLFIGILFAILVPSAVTQSIAEDAIRSGHWNKSEQKEYRGCISRLPADTKAKSGAPPETWCELAEEYQHWMHGHPGMTTRKENHAKFHQCNREHAAEMNGTPEQFYAAFDLCLREAYGMGGTK
jgi:hypothetical protein